MFDPDEVVKTYKIPIERVIAIEVLTHEKILQHENATVDGGIPIKEAFGYIADRIEDEAQNRLARAPVVFTIAFFDKDNNIKNISFAVDTFFDLCNRFSKDFYEVFNRKGMQENKSNINEQGEYML
jgi:hypothetical protein